MNVGMEPISRLVARQMGPRDFWERFCGIWRGAREQGRDYLLWREWAQVVALCDETGIFAYFRREGRAEIIGSDFFHSLGATMVMSALQRAKRARKRGLTPRQFHDEEEQRLADSRATAFRVERQMVQSRRRRPED